MTGPPNKKPGSHATEPIPNAAAKASTAAAQEKAPEPVDEAPTSDMAPTSRLDYESPTIVFPPLDAEATTPLAAPPSAAFVRARWPSEREAPASTPPPTPPSDVITPRVPPHSAAEPVEASAPPPGTIPATVPMPPVDAARPRAPTTAQPGTASGAGRPAASAPTLSPAAPRAMARAPRRRHPRFGTILWGVLLLGFAAFMVAWTALPVPPDPTRWLLGAVILVGVLLVVAGIAAASRRAG